METIARIRREYFGKGKSFKEITALSYLAPDIVTAILGGRKPVGLTLSLPLRSSSLPAMWHDQCRLLGFS